MLGIWIGGLDDPCTWFGLDATLAHDPAVKVPTEYTMALQPDISEIHFMHVFMESLFGLDYSLSPTPQPLE